jgi:hypothetical protein
MVYPDVFQRRKRCYDHFSEGKPGFRGEIRNLENLRGLFSNEKSCFAVVFRVKNERINSKKRHFPSELFISYGKIFLQNIS